MKKFIILFLFPFVVFAQVRRKPVNSSGPALPTGNANQYIRADGAVQPLTPAGLKLGTMSLQRPDSINITGGVVSGVTRVLIGTTTNAGYFLDVNGPARVSDGLTVANGSGSTYVQIQDGVISKATGGNFTFSQSATVPNLQNNGSYLFPDAAKLITGASGASLIINGGTNDIAIMNGASALARFNSSAVYLSRATIFQFFAKTAAYTVGQTDHTISADATTAAFTITLPTSVGKAGMVYTFKRINTGVNNVTIGTTSSQTIDGVSTYVLSAQWKHITVQSDGANWLIIANN